MTVAVAAPKPTSVVTRDGEVPQTEQLQIIDEKQHFTYVASRKPS